MDIRFRFLNHEKSKKHLRQVQLLREKMEEEDEQFEEYDEVVQNCDSSDASEIHLEESVSQPLKHFNGKPLDHSDAGHLSTQPDAPENADEDEDETLLKNFVNIKLKKSHLIEEEDGHIDPTFATSLDSSVSNQPRFPAEQSKTKKRRRAPKGTKSAQPASHQIQKEENEMDASTPGSHISCTSCRKNFENKTQLFKHLKQFPGHAALKPSSETQTTKGKKGRSRK